MSNSSCVCLPRLVVRTSGFHPDNMGSIPVGDAKDLDTFKVFFCETNTSSSAGGSESFSYT